MKNRAICKKYQKNNVNLSLYSPNVHDCAVDLPIQRTIDFIYIIFVCVIPCRRLCPPYSFFPHMHVMCVCVCVRVCVCEFKLEPGSNKGKSSREAALSLVFYMSNSVTHAQGLLYTKFR